MPLKNSKMIVKDDEGNKFFAIIIDPTAPLPTVELIDKKGRATIKCWQEFIRYYKGTTERPKNFFERKD